MSDVLGEELDLLVPDVASALLEQFEDMQTVVSVRAEAFAMAVAISARFMWSSLDDGTPEYRQDRDTFLKFCGLAFDLSAEIVATAESIGIGKASN